jgi:hypothetical protein
LAFVAEGGIDAQENNSVDALGVCGTLWSTRDDPLSAADVRRTTYNIIEAHHVMNVSKDAVKAAETIGYV